MIARVVLGALVLGLVAAVPPALGQRPVSIAVDGVAREIPAIERQGRRFVALEDVAALLGGRVDRIGGESAVMNVDEHRLEILRRLPFVSFDGRWFQLAEPAQKDGRGFWLPADAVVQLLPVLFPGRFPPVVEGATRVPARGSDLEGVDVRVESGRTRLGFRLASTPGVVVDDGRPGTIRLELVDATLPPAVARGLAGVGLVDSVAVVGEGDGLVVWTDPAARVYAVSPTRRPPGFELTLLTAPEDEAAALLVSTMSEARPDPRRRSEAERAVWEIDIDSPGAAPGEPPAVPPPAPRRGAWKLVLDAGHGGHDPGARGPSGSAEKNVTLAITRALAEALEARGVNVVLTRSDDTFVPLGERTKIANRERADLFVSVHANSAENRSAHGFETYFLSAAKTEDARRVARMENAAIRYESAAIDATSLDDLNFILRDLAQNEYLRESSALAEMVQEELDGRLPLRSRGVKQAPFFVLNGAYMPAILFETAFISNPREESLLNDPGFRTRLVDGLAESIIDFLDRHGRKTAAPMAAR